MYTIRVEADFAAAHFLRHYHGKCERLHGHNYRVRVWARGKELSEGGMLIDFGVLKEGLRTVLGQLDHRNLNDIAYFQDDPSAERIARYVFEELTALLKEQQLPYNLLWAVDVFETPTSMARYEGE
ncbi:MAG TPA: 6-carboxytetrahydropterin synthase QueD [Termitinemataceae bacterium]|uniref:6-carboxytetrahydropterin synthase QueD n=1 Tax=Treponema sp. J25 TaxID=2094121 RepID=UPI0010501D78|nr:6-carboxytetrahydropterin synthase QueD [Treponema sp. J25]TCW62317.1 6-carboxytetrahydropterin synthase QueD [Treponema sp. J25]HOJ99361.1 6-carboxytetrahydropterin synthase QueD [Termitinemataceae bacterium]HOM22498.1 6-carboxytetrahydropterin synthase QueD [Termitinemataceae bacterium]HPQ00731.1 6-carboxytetrahydropterin synthase QueD [Termitinemataceae bacterium]